MAIFSWAVQSILIAYLFYTIFSMVAQTVKRLPAMQETWVRSLGGEDPLEKEMAPRSSTLAWKIPWVEEPGGLQSMGLPRVGHDWATSLSLFTFSMICIKSMFKFYLEIYKYMQQFMAWLSRSTFVSYSLPPTSYSTAASEPRFLPNFTEIWQINQWPF